MCDNCGLVAVAEMPTIGQLKNYYNKTYFQGGIYYDYPKDALAIRRNARERIRQINQICSPGKCLDVGCAFGFFMKVAQEHGWKTWGVELSPYAAKYATCQLGLPVVQGEIHEIKKIISEESLDLVTMWDSIEHVRDPMNILKDTANLLKPRGYLVLSTGDIDSFFSKIMGKHWRLITPDHLYYYSSKTMTQYLKKIGFEIINISKPGRFVSVNFILHILHRKAKMSFIHKIVAKFPPIKINLWDVMVVIARKRTPNVFRMESSEINRKV